MPGANPAGRLLVLIEASLKIPTNKNYADGWRELLGIEGRDRSFLLERLGPMLRLPFDAKQAAERLGDAVDQELVLEWVPRVERAFSNINLEGNWDQFRGHINGETLLSLRFCSDQLGRLAPENSL